MVDGSINLGCAQSTCTGRIDGDVPEEEVNVISFTVSSSEPNTHMDEAHGIVTASKQLEQDHTDATSTKGKIISRPILYIIYNF